MQRHLGNVVRKIHISYIKCRFSSAECPVTIMKLVCADIKTKLPNDNANTAVNIM